MSKPWSAQPVSSQGWRDRANGFRGHSNSQRDGSRKRGRFKKGGDSGDGRLEVHRDLVQRLCFFKPSDISPPFDSFKKDASLLQAEEDEVTLDDYKTVVTYSLVNDDEKPTIRIPGTPPVLIPNLLDTPFQASLFSDAFDTTPPKHKPIYRRFPFAPLVQTVNHHHAAGGLVHSSGKTDVDVEKSHYDFLQHDVIAEMGVLGYLICCLSGTGASQKFRESWRIDVASIEKTAGLGNGVTLLMAVWEDDRKRRRSSYWYSVMNHFTKTNDPSISRTFRVVSFSILGMKILSSKEEEACDPKLFGFDEEQERSTPHVEAASYYKPRSVQKNSLQVPQTIPQINVQFEEARKQIPSSAIVDIHTRSKRSGIDSWDWVTLWSGVFLHQLSTLHLYQHKKGLFTEKDSHQLKVESNEKMLNAKRDAQIGLKRLPELLQRLKKLSMENGEMSLVFEQNDDMEWGLSIWKRQDGSRRLIDPFLPDTK